MHGLVVPLAPAGLHIHGHEAVGKERVAGPVANPLCQPIAYRAGFNANQQLEFTLTVGA